MTYIHMHYVNELGLCTLHARTVIIQVEVEKMVEEVELETKKVFPQVNNNNLLTYT